MFRYDRVFTIIAGVYRHQYSTATTYAKAMDIVEQCTQMFNKADFYRWGYSLTTEFGQPVKFVIWFAEDADATLFATTWA